MSEENKRINDGEESLDKERENAPLTDKTENEETEVFSVDDFDVERLYEECGEEGESQMKEPKKISLGAFIISAIALMLAAVMTTWYFCYGFYRARISEITEDGVTVIENSTSLSDLELLSAIFRTFSYFDLEEDEMAERLLKTYVLSTGDRYAQYFSGEEYESFIEDAMGNTDGIGINIIYVTVDVDGTLHRALKVTNIVSDSPAMRAGMKVGDYICFVGNDEEMRVSVGELGYDEALLSLQGVSGTVAEFTVIRENEDGSFEEIPFSVTREKIISDSVLYHLCKTDESVGIVKIIEFDYTTPAQFSAAVDALRAEGAERFVFDVRYNGGGDLASIVAVLSYFLDPGQTIISTVNRQGKEEIIRAGIINWYTGDAAGCNVSREDVGKYKGLPVAVLCNGTTASAAELFTATFRDYGIAKIVGTTTYGKGSMQSILSLKYFGLEGALKLTTNMYFPPSGESYEGIGITPDVTVELDEALKNKNIYEFTDAEDNQLQAAIETLK